MTDGGHRDTGRPCYAHEHDRQSTQPSDTAQKIIRKIGVQTKILQTK